jgi:TRAP-type C4-dicarboxylate transport system substrate-binding protein
MNYMSPDNPNEREVRHMKRLLGVFLSMSLILVFYCAAAGAKTTITAVSAWPKTTYEVQNFMKFLDMLKANAEKKYPGELEIVYKGGPEVIPNREQVEALRNGLIDMVFTTDGYYVSIIPEVNALSLTTLRPWEERARGVNDLLNKLHQEKANAYYLGRLGTDIPFTLYLTKPIKSADLTGLKIRCSPTHVNFLKKLGAQPLVIPPPDVYTALERGVADGYVWPAGLIRDWGWQEVTKYIVEPSFYIAANVVLVNLSTWQKLPPHLQKLLIETEEQAEHVAVERGEAHVKSEFDAFKKMGIQFITLPPAEAAKLRDAAYSSLWDIVIQKSPENGPKLKKLLSGQ